MRRRGDGTGSDGDGTSTGRNERLLVKLLQTPLLQIRMLLDAVFRCWHPGQREFFVGDNHDESADGDRRGLPTVRVGVFARSCIRSAAEPGCHGGSKVVWPEQDVARASWRVYRVPVRSGGGTKMG